MLVDGDEYRYVEKNVSRHKGVRYYFRHAHVGRVRLPDPAHDRDHFITMHQACLDRVLSEKKRLLLKAKPRGKRKKKAFLNPFFQYSSHLRQRAIRRGMDFGLSADWFRRTLEAQNGRCAVTGIILEMKGHLGEKSPYQVSVDRKDPTLGYTPENCRLVILAVNYAMNIWGEKVFMEIVARTVREQQAATP